MRKRTIGLATAIGGALVVGGLISRVFFSSPSDLQDVTIKETPTTIVQKTTVPISIPSPNPTIAPKSTPELKYDVLSIDLEKMLFEEEDIPRVVNERVLGYRSHIQSGYPTQCQYPQLERRELRIGPFEELLFKSAKVCATRFSIELLGRQYGITAGLTVYNSVEGAKEALASYTTKIKEECTTNPQGTCPKMKDFIVQHPAIGNESILFANVPGQDADIRIQWYFLHFRRDNFIGYIIGTEPLTRTYLDLNSILEMGKTIQNRITNP